MLATGQVSAVILGAYAAAWIAWDRDHETLGGLLLSLCLLKFQLVAGFCAVLLLRRRFRALAGVAAGALVLYALGTVIAGPAWPLDEIRITRTGEDLGGYGWIMPNLHGLVARMTGQNHMAIVLAASVAVILLAAFTRGNKDREFCAALVASMLASWHMNPHDLVLTLIPLCLSDRLGWPGWAFVGASGGLIAGCIFWANPHDAALMGIPLLALFALLVFRFPRVVLTENLGDSAIDGPG